MHVLQFLNPWYLTAAAAALIPLVIFLVQRHRAQRVVFGSVWFLRDLAKHIVRRRRASELLLLFLRMAVVAAVAAAFARPVLLKKSTTGGGAVSGIKARAVLVDISGSMGIGNRMQEARRAAAAAVDGLAPGDVVAVYAFGNGLETVAGWTSDRAAARTAVEALRSTDQGSDLSDALRRVQTEILDRVEQDKDILVVSDMQAAAWKDYQGDWVMSRAVTLSFADVAGDGKPPANVGITQVSVPRSTVLGSSEETLSARVQNFDAQDRTVKLTLALQGKEIASRSVPLAASSSQVVSFPHRFSEAGDAAGRFALDVQDEYAPDNQAYFVVSVQPKVKVVVVNGSSSDDPKADGAYCLVRAFAPSRESSFDALEVLPADWRADDLGGVSVVVLSDVAALPETTLGRLRQFVARGGGIFFFVGGKTVPETFNRQFADLAPCRLERRVNAHDEDGSLDGVVIGELNAQHAILQLFSQPHHGDFGTVHFKQYYTVLDSQAATVLARFENKRPAILFKQVGKGTAVLVASSANQEMNDFSLRSVFVPFVQEAAKFQAAASGGRVTDASLGNGVVVELPAGATAATLTDPAGAESNLEIGSQKVRAGDSPIAVPAVHFLPTVAGIYRVRAGKEEFVFAANTDPRESDLKRMKGDEIAAALTSQRGVEDKGDRTLRVAAKKSQREEIENSQRLGWRLLLAAATLLLAEMVLADRITIRD